MTQPTDLEALAAKLEQMRDDPATPVQTGLVLHQAATALHTIAQDAEPVAKLLEAISKEAVTANEVISLNRDGSGSGRVKVATAMHRIAKWAQEVLTHPSPAPQADADTSAVNGSDGEVERVAKAIHEAHMVEKGPLAAWLWEEASKPFYDNLARAAIVALRHDDRDEQENG